MIEGFEELDSTKIGRAAEKLCSKWLTEQRGFVIKENGCREYDTVKDLKVSKEDRSYLIEIKGDNYHKGPNIALEYMQEAMNKTIKPSGLSTTGSEYIFYYVFR